jgi:hypothetical protein
MPDIRSAKGAAVATANALQNCPATTSDNLVNNPSTDSASIADAMQPTSKWRSQYKVHPAADVFPMMSDEGLKKLGEDITEHGLLQPLVFDDVRSNRNRVLLDGRNRLEAMERAGLSIDHLKECIGSGHVEDIISLNIHRRHLTKQQQAELIVAALKAAQPKANKPPQVEEVSKGGRSKVNELKAKAVAIAKDAKISKGTVERALAKAKGKTPKPSPPPKPIAGPRLRTKPKLETHTGVDAARRYYIDEFRKLEAAERDAEFEVLIDEIKGVQRGGFA